MAIKPTAFELHVPDAAIADLRERLARTRWPDQAPGAPWAHGSRWPTCRNSSAHWRDTLRLACTRGAAQRVAAVQGAAARHRRALPARAGPGPESVSAAAVARLAGLGVRVPRDHSASHRPGAIRRRCGRCVHRGGAVVAGLRPVVRAGPAALRHRADRRLFRRADERRTRATGASPRKAATGARSSRRGWAPCMPTGCSASTSTCSACAAIRRC